MNYYLKIGDYYLEDYEITLNDKGFMELVNYTIGKNYKRAFYLIEQAEDIRKLIFIETGLDLTIKKFKKEDNLNGTSI